MRQSSIVRATGAFLVVAVAAAVMGVTASAQPVNPTARATSGNAPAASADDPWIVSLGDSFISGEAGRWAGNESLSTADIDALGAKAYWDAESGERITRCHRSRSAEIHIGVVNSLNLACSGATTRSQIDSAGNWKPGIDFVRNASRKGQALMLEEFAADHDVRMVVLSIGGNDLNFSPIITECVTAYVERLSKGCRNNPKVKAWVSDDAVDKVTAAISRAIGNVQTAMRDAGRADGDWTLVVQLYPTVLPFEGRFRYGQGLFSGRQSVGGCGFWNDDASWALRTVLPKLNGAVRGAVTQAAAENEGLQTVIFDNSDAFRGHALCDEAVHRVHARDGWGRLVGPRDWKASNAADRSEWVQDINIINTGATYQQESLHPNYWGQLALRNCLRQVWNDGQITGGKCTPTGGLNGRGEPNMELAMRGEG